MNSTFSGQRPLYTVLGNRAHCAYRGWTYILYLISISENHFKWNGMNYFAGGNAFIGISGAAKCVPV